MPWQCPACASPIHHTETLPNPAVTYRCQVCRLELRVDAHSGKLAVLPLHDDEPRAPRPPRR